LRYQKGILMFLVIIMVISACSKSPQSMETLSSHSSEDVEQSEISTGGNEDESSDAEESSAWERTELVSGNVNFEISDKKLLISYEMLQSKGYQFVGGKVVDVVGVYHDNVALLGYKEEEKTYMLGIGSMEGGIVNEICHLPKHDIMYYCKIVNGDIYVVVSSLEERIKSQLIQISLLGESSVLKEWNSVRGPIVYNTENEIVLSYETGTSCIMEMFDTEGEIWEHIRTTEFCCDENGLGTGSYLLYGGGISGQCLFYELANLNNEFLDQAKNTEILVYDRESRVSEAVVIPERKSMFLYGDRDVLICCEYEYDYPLKEPVVIYNFKEGYSQRLNIPGVYSSRAFKHIEKKSSDLYACGNGKSLFMLDFVQDKIIRITPKIENVPEDKLLDGLSVAEMTEIKWLDVSEGMAAINFNGEIIVVDVVYE